MIESTGRAAKTLLAFVLPISACAHQGKVTHLEWAEHGERLRANKIR